MTLYAAGFFPVSTKIPEGAIGRGVIPAVELALQHINDSPKVLRGIHLDLVWNDTEVSRDQLPGSFVVRLALSVLAGRECSIVQLRLFTHSVSNCVLQECKKMGSR